MHFFTPFAHRVKRAKCYLEKSDKRDTLSYPSFVSALLYNCVLKSPKAPEFLAIVSGHVPAIVLPVLLCPYHVAYMLLGSLWRCPRIHT